MSHAKMPLYNVLWWTGAELHAAPGCCHTSECPGRPWIVLVELQGVVYTARRENSIAGHQWCSEQHGGGASGLPSSSTL